MPEAIFRELFEKFLLDNMSPDEVRRFQRMAQDPGNRRLLDRLLREAYENIRPASSESESYEQVFAEIMSRARLEELADIPAQPGRVVQVYRQYRAAVGASAAILCLAFAGFFAYRAYLGAGVAASIHAGIGERKNLTLPDGSKVILNAGSTLVLHSGFNTAGRVVTLTGEAYFDVAKNARMPFMIHIPSMDIRVLGTTFDVRAYPDEVTDIASLIDGKIEVTVKQGMGKTGQKDYYLSPLQKITVNKTESVVALSDGHTAVGQGKALPEIDSLRVNRLVDEIPETAWTDNKLFFNAEPLSQVTTKIEKWYGVTVRLDNPAIGNLHFTGSYQNESLDEVMEAIELSNPEVHHRMENNGKLLVLY